VIKDWNLSKNKSAELQITKWGDSQSWFVFEVDLNWNGGDHAGPGIEISVWKYMFHMCIYDHRHWDHTTSDWDDGSDDWVPPLNKTE